MNFRNYSVGKSSETVDSGLPAEHPGDIEELGEGSFVVIASPAMRKLRAQVDQVAKIDVPVLVLGESGTGKEVVARLIHRLSPRFHRPFLKVNCAALPAELLESELFGHERGAFTGAVRPKPGKFEACNRGTLFLDEIAEMSPALQAKLLHVLQDQEFTRLGSCSAIRVDVRVIAATNVNIRAAIAARAFREDLYYRLSTFVFSLPPLRERPEDIPVLLRHYLANYANSMRLPQRVVSAETWASCLRHSWPGNVRELQNFAKRYLICGDEGGVLTAVPAGNRHSAEGALALETAAPPAAAPGDLKSHMRGLRNTAEAAAIGQALAQTNWNRKEAAKVLKISYKSILLKIRQYALDRVTPVTLAKYKVQEETLALTARADTRSGE